MQCASMDVHQVFSKGRPISGLPCYVNSTDNNLFKFKFNAATDLSMYTSDSFTSHALKINENSLGNSNYSNSIFFFICQQILDSNLFEVCLNSISNDHHNGRRKGVEAEGGIFLKLNAVGAARQRL